MASREYNQLYYKLNREKLIKQAQIYAKNNKESVKFKNQEYYKNNKEKYKKYYLENKETIKINNAIWEVKNKQKRLEQRRDRAKNNRTYETAKNANYRAAKLNQTPKWADLKDIETFYINCPKGYHVDHIVPLQGKNVRGFHVIYNLQYLSANDNIKKGNRL